MKLKAVRIMLKLTTKLFFPLPKVFQPAIFLDKKRDFHRCKKGAWPKAAWNKPGSFVLSCALNGMF